MFLILWFCFSLLTLSLKTGLLTSREEVVTDGAFTPPETSISREVSLHVRSMVGADFSCVPSVKAVKTSNVEVQLGELLMHLVSVFWRRKACVVNSPWELNWSVFGLNSVRQLMMKWIANFFLNYILKRRKRSPK